MSEAAAHDLAAAGLGEVAGEEDGVGAGDGAGLLHHVLAQLALQLLASGLALLQRDEGGDG
jgi:hypothetical protein